jgi:ketosteroid isomerase-like protein
MSANTSVVQSAYDAFAKGDIPGVINLLSEDVEWSSPSTLPHGGHFHGQDGVGKFFAGIGAAWQGLGLDIESVSDAGDNVVIGVVRADGTRQDGRSEGYGATHLFTVSGDKIVRFREYTDLDSPLA